MHQAHMVAAIQLFTEKCNVCLLKDAALTLVLRLQGTARVIVGPQGADNGTSTAEDVSECAYRLLGTSESKLAEQALVLAGTFFHRPATAMIVLQVDQHAADVIQDDGYPRPTGLAAGFGPGTRFRV